MQGDLKDIEYYMFLEDGSVQLCRGAFYIVDGGLPDMGCFVCPIHSGVDRKTILFSEWLESVRKDVECVFGILKIRWRFLKNAIECGLTILSVVSACF